MSRRGNARSVSGIVGGALAVLIALASPAPAQNLNNTFGGLSENSDQPIDIESDTLTVYDAKKYATFKGNVKAVQGTTTLRAIELDVHYVGGANKLTGQSEETPPVAPQQAPQQAKGDADSAESRINKIEARGSVVITSEDDQTTTSDWAIYDVPAGLVTVGGNVVLSQGQNVLKGDRLVIDLKTGESRFENTGTAATGGRRIRALFMPKEDGANPKKRKKAGDNAAESPQAPSGPMVDDNEPLPLVPEFR
ncbi:MAG: LptA/OstA family protein [Methyloceanibacter sp.]|uniref:LptA/OstA family protein n=1 Tax=Methyloceanibacter sp. TaxID=1965321 RepID=UPI003EDFAF35